MFYSGMSSPFSYVGNAATSQLRSTQNCPKPFP